MINCSEGKDIKLFSLILGKGHVFNRCVGCRESEAVSMQVIITVFIKGDGKIGLKFGYHFSIIPSRLA